MESRKCDGCKFALFCFLSLAANIAMLAYSCAVVLCAYMRFNEQKQQHYYIVTIRQREIDNIYKYILSTKRNRQRANITF